MFTDVETKNKIRLGWVEGPEELQLVEKTEHRCGRQGLEVRPKSASTFLFAGHIVGTT